MQDFITGPKAYTCNFRFSVLPAWEGKYGGRSRRTFAETGRFPFTPLCGDQRYLSTKHEYAHYVAGLNMFTEKSRVRIR